MKVSIITATYNRAATIKGTLDSIRDQDYSDIEHIIVDGASKDNTLEIIEQYKIPNTKILSEPDKGIFDAWNKGLKMATGDVIGFLHSDDFYPNNQVISDVVMTLKSTGKDAVFGDVSFVEPENLNKVVRYYSSEKFHPDRFAYGYMPAHPSFFTKKEFYDKCGEFKIDYKIAADYEFLIRLLYVHKISYQYIKKSMVYMRTGGISTAGLKSRYVLNKEIVRACRENGISTNLGKVLLKVFSKLKELRV